MLWRMNAGIYISLVTCECMLRQKKFLPVFEQELFIVFKGLEKLRGTEGRKARGRADRTQGQLPFRVRN